MRNYIVIDTETAPTIKTNECKPEIMRVYDLGYCVVDGNTGAIIERRSFIVSETFYNANLMNSAYYADKLPQYHDGIKTGEWEVASLLNIRKQIISDCKEYNVKRFYAYNARFDEIALNETIKDYSNGYVCWFLPYGCEWRDIMRFASDTICATKKYANYCKENNYITTNGNIRMTAEIVYRYICGNDDFVERHTALSDAEIETEILRACLKRHGKRSKKFGRSYTKKKNH